jgi:histidyl-tRNA synthetase
MNRIQSPKGTYDILPAAISSELWQSSQAWQSLEAILHQYCNLWGFQEIRLPIFESTDLFCKSTGNSSDIVQKEMYTFIDKGQRSLTLRPEGTPGTLRALIEASVFQDQPLQKVFYLGPMFRYERPQQGRYRQFHQFGAEAIGARFASLDADTIGLSWSITQALGLKECCLKINTLANETTRQRFREKLKAYFSLYKDKLSSDSLRRLELNPLRILDSKDAADRELLLDCPKINTVIDKESQQFFDQVLELLTQANIPYQIDDNLVRGIDYYCDTVFELHHPQKGQSLGDGDITLGGGGRYGKLLSAMGGPPYEGIGFAFGVERLLQMSLDQGILNLKQDHCDLFIIALGPISFSYAFALTMKCRMQGLRVELWPDDDTKKLKNALSYADKIKTKYVGILGENELKLNKIQVRQMDTREQALISIDHLVNYIKPI